MVNRNLWGYSAVKFTAKITLIILESVGVAAQLKKGFQKNDHIKI